MKKTILLALLISSIFIISSCTAYQTVSFTEDEAYVQVYDSLADNKDDLFIKANDWMITTFIKATSVIEYSDKESGTLLGKYLMAGTVKTGAYGVSVDTRVYSKIDIRVKDNKARIIITPLTDWKYDSSGFTIYNYSKEQALLDMAALSDSLNKKLESTVVDF